MRRARLLWISLFALVWVVGFPAPAQAGVFLARADIADNGAAVATLSDTLVPSNRYLLTLTAIGGGTCGIPGPLVQIADTDMQGIANPVNAYTAGACDLYDAEVTYLVAWVGSPGASGQLPIVCTWVKGTKQCTPTELSVAAP